MSMNIRLRSSLPVHTSLWLWLLVAGAMPLTAQDSTVEEVTSATAEEATEIPPLAEIFTARSDLDRAIFEISGRLDDRTLLESSRARLEPIERDLGSLLQQLEVRRLPETDISTLMELDTSAFQFESQLKQIIAELDKAARSLESDIDALQELRSRWQELATVATVRDAPADLISVVEDKTAAIEDSVLKVEVRRDEVLDLLEEATRLFGKVSDFRARNADARRDMARQAMIREGQPLWRLNLQRRGDRLVEHVRIQLRSDTGHLTSYFRDNARLLSGLILASVGFTLFVLRRLQKLARIRRAQDETAALAATMVDPPWALTIMLSLGLVIWLAPLAPPIFYKLLLVVVPLAAAVLALRILGPSIRLSILMLSGALVFFPWQSYFELSPLLDRLVIIAQSGAVAAALTIDLRKGRWTNILPPKWNSVGIAGLRLSVILLLLAVLGAVSGEIGPARMLRSGVVGALSFALVFTTLFLALDSLIATWLTGPAPQRLKALRDKPETFRRFSRKVLSTAAIVGWSLASLFAFDLHGEAKNLLQTIFASGIRIRDIDITLGEVLAFALVMTASIVIARIVAYLLQEEFLPRLGMQRGLPYAISTVARYVILLIGFSLALAALGIDLSKATLLAGAFGVGIGFGLQNVVNNFVSGLILLFERPVQVGDTVEIGTLLGEVTEIGIRASTIKTFQGAEVIVPNGDLIAKEVVNWTLSNRRRRVEISIGVAYGTDPEEVLAILERSARDHPAVGDDPEPSVIFTGFGESSLDFQLRCWVDDFSQSLQVASELRIAINRALGDAGIEIPYPQRDIRIRPAEDSDRDLASVHPAKPGTAD